MDDLAANVTSLLGVQEECIGQEVPQLSLASNLHPRLFADLYKKKRLSHSSQEERRRTILNEQKKKRQSLIESNRSQNVENVEHHEKKQSPSKPIYKISEKFSNRLMYSEWLEEVPSDFDSNWIMVLCPVGKRCLVVASEGTTTVYNKAGKTIAKHSSILPGGSRESKSDETILDCVYNDYLRTYFVLDCLCWKSHPIIDSETEFRFFWLRCKLDEFPALNQWSHSNPYVFKDVSRTFPLNPLSIREQLERINEPKIDGVLFYHKETHYTSGSTPLVGWLKTYMLPEILGVPVPQKIAESTPSDYLNAKQAISIDKSRSSTSTTSSIADYRNSADEDTMSDDTDGGFLASN